MPPFADSKAASPVATDPLAQTDDTTARDSKAASQVATDQERPRPPRAVQSTSLCDPYREWITSALEQKRNATSIWQELVDEHGFQGKYNSVKRFVRELRGSAVRLAHPTIITEPGEEAQVDYGEGPMVRHPETGKYRRTRLFALTLGWSRKAVWLLAWKSSSQVWCELHAEAFCRLGGVPRVVVLDNLKEGVIDPEKYDPTLNPLYRDFLAHYGVVGLPARVRHPDRKGKVERSVGYAQDTPLKGKRFETLEEAQAYIDKWAERWADTRIHGTTKRQVAAMFAEEKPHLGALPTEPFRFYKHGRRTVHLDGCVEIEAAYYGAPPGRIGQELEVQWDDLRVRLIDPATGQLMRELAKRKRGYREVHPDDIPERTPAGTLQLLARAKNAGDSIGAVCELIHAKKDQAGVRRIQGVLSLVKKYGPSPVEQACECAIETGCAEYRFVRRLLERNPPVPVPLRQIDPLIRQLSEYQAFVLKSTTRTEPS